MAQVDLYKNDGSKIGQVNLPDELFAVHVDGSLVHEAVVAQEANSRVRLAHVKDRSEVRGGGRKPWRQKGTGRARHGSTRSPIWIGGGVTFGPTRDRNFSRKINKKAKKKAIAMVLSDKVAETQFLAVEDFAFPEAKTKFVSNMRRALPGANSTALIITTKEDSNVIRATQNLAKTATINATSLNVVDLMKYKYLVASKAAIEKMKETYL